MTFPIFQSEPPSFFQYLQTLLRDRLVSRAFGPPLDSLRFPTGSPSGINLKVGLPLSGKRSEFSDPISHRASSFDCPLPYFFFSPPVILVSHSITIEDSSRIEATCVGAYLESAFALSFCSRRRCWYARVSVLIVRGVRLYSTPFDFE